MSRYLQKRFASLAAYQPGEQPQDKAYIKLNTNESPYPPSPEVIAAVGRKEMEDLRLYSDPTGRVLCEKLAKRYGVTPDMVFLSNGSDDILNFAFMAYASDGGKVAFPDISYGFYSVYAALHRSDALVIPLKEDLSLDPDKYCGLDRMIVIANPNAPTGLALTPSQIEKILSSNPHRVVLIDEAYVDFGAESCLPLLTRYDNLLIVRTYSKSRSLAGARLGFALASPEIIADLNRLKYSTNPYNVNRLTLLAGAAAIDSDEYFMDNCRRVAATRQKTSEALMALGFEVLPSLANFLFVRHPAFRGEDLYRLLKERGILIRHFSAPRIHDYLRITVGSDEEMNVLISVLKELLSKGASL